MSPLRDRAKVTPPYERPNLNIYGFGVEYPPYEINAADIATLARRHYPSTPA